MLGQDGRCLGEGGIRIAPFQGGSGAAQPPVIDGGLAPALDRDQRLLPDHEVARVAHDVAAKGPQGIPSRCRDDRDGAASRVAQAAGQRHGQTSSGGMGDIGRQDTASARGIRDTQRRMPSHDAHIAHVIGARPNFIKAAPVIRALRDRGLAQRVIHTGQHYDERMSEIFFRELDLPTPDVNLGIGSGTHGEQTAGAMVGLEREWTTGRPALVVLYGDVNSTLAASLVAAKLQVSSAHVEAGLRSFDRTMPEEINRIVSDLLADLLFTTSPEATDHLTAMGVDGGRIHFVGNPMIDTLMAQRARFDPAPERHRLGLPATYGVVTLHRPSNVDDMDSARAVVNALQALAERLPLVIPLHPRGATRLAEAGLRDGERLRIVEPLGYVAFLSLVAGARLVLTDSGGIQEETTMLDVPCLTMRPNTERPITISHGTNRLVRPDEVAGAADAILAGPERPSGPRPPLWDGHAGERIADVIGAWLPTPGG
jgi:UDP-N-acetylglucosamine 2-epimerase (non-hydrolysing)